MTRPSPRYPWPPVNGGFRPSSSPKISSRTECVPSGRCDRDVCPPSAVLVGEAMVSVTSTTVSPPAGDDERLLIEAAQRDPLRFAALYERHFERVYAFVARRAAG